MSKFLEPQRWTELVDQLVNNLPCVHKDVCLITETQEKTSGNGGTFAGDSSTGCGDRKIYTD